MHMHVFFVNHSSALHLRFSVHIKHLFRICQYSLHTSLLLMQTTMDANNYINLTKLKVESLE